MGLIPSVRIALDKKGEKVILNRRSAKCVNLNNNNYNRVPQILETLLSKVT